MSAVYLIPAPAICKETRDLSITLSQGIELEISVYPATGPELLLFIYPTSNKGIKAHHEFMAGQLASANIEVWLADLTDALFLPRGSSTLRKLTGEYLSDLIDKAHSRSGKNIYIAGNSYAAIPVLRGAYQWQKRNANSNYLNSVLLFSPKLYKGLPQLGNIPEYLPIASATNIPMILFQGDKHGNKWQLPYLLNTLRSNNDNIYVEIVPEVGSLFSGKKVSEKQKRFFKNIPTRLQFFSNFRSKNSTLKTAKNISFDLTTNTGIDNQLKNYTGNTKPLPIKLLDYTGHTFELNNYKDQVTVINFWATWCAPCIKEIPSLNRLKQKMKNKSFELVSINFQEKPDTIREFQKKIKLEFPVLMDTDGTVAKDWKVIAFPSTFIIGSDGKIQYGVNAGIEWDTPEVMQIINSLY